MTALTFPFWSGWVLIAVSERHVNFTLQCKHTLDIDPLLILRDRIPHVDVSLVDSFSVRVPSLGMEGSRGTGAEAEIRINSNTDVVTMKYFE